MSEELQVVEMPFESDPTVLSATAYFQELLAGKTRDDMLEILKTGGCKFEGVWAAAIANSMIAINVMLLDYVEKNKIDPEGAVWDHHLGRDNETGTIVFRTSMTVGDKAPVEFYACASKCGCYWSVDADGLCSDCVFNLTAPDVQHVAHSVALVAN